MTIKEAKEKIKHVEDLNLKLELLGITILLLIVLNFR